MIRRSYHRSHVTTDLQAFQRHCIHYLQIHLIDPQFLPFEPLYSPAFTTHSKSFHLYSILDSIHEFSTNKHASFFDANLQTIEKESNAFSDSPLIFTAAIEDTSNTKNHGLKSSLRHLQNLKMVHHSWIGLSSSRFVLLC